MKKMGKWMVDSKMLAEMMMLLILFSGLDLGLLKKENLKEKLKEIQKIQKKIAKNFEFVV